MKPSLSLISKTAYADAILNGDLDPEARKQITRLRDQWAADEATVVRRPGACKRIDCKPTYERDLERAKKIDSFLAGSIRLIHVSSIYEHLIKQVLASFPLGEPPRKAPGAPDLTIARAAIVRSRPAPPEPIPAPTCVHERVAAPARPSATKRARGRPKKQPEMAAAPAE